MMVMLEQSLLTWKQDRDLRTALSMSPVCLESCLDMEWWSRDVAWTNHSPPRVAWTNHSSPGDGVHAGQQLVGGVVLVAELHRDLQHISHVNSCSLHHRTV